MGTPSDLGERVTAEKQKHQQSTEQDAVLPAEENAANPVVASKSPTTNKEAVPAETPVQPTDIYSIERVAPSTEDYSIFTVTQKRTIVVAASFASLFSPMTGSIYYPALNTIANDLHVSASKVNLTVTTYLIIQGLAPMIIAGFSDNAGRRPAYIACFITYLAANLALGLQNNYAALLVLRCLQSGGSSGTVALANGVIGDIITSAERGAYIAFASAPQTLGPTLSPIIGGLLSQYLGWHSVFWFLLIWGGCFFILLFLFLPETCRKVVGDGSIPPPKTSTNITDAIRHANRRKAGIPLDTAKQEELRKNYKLHFPNPLTTLIVLADLESALILGACGLSLACFYAISTGAASAFKSLYGFNDILISVMFIPIGVGGGVAVFTTGKMVDWNYRRHAKRNNFPVTKNRQQDLTNFPIEQARLEIALPLFYLGAVSMVGYGWIMDHKVSLAGPVILLFVMGYGLTAAFQVLNILMVDIYPGRPATATAANNIVRCELGAAASAAIVPMSEAMGNGWAYTLLTLLFIAYSPALWACMWYGMKWRKAKREKKDRETAAVQERNKENQKREEST